MSEEGSLGNGQALIARVGARVRASREGRGMARRVLSERSGVSPRYLAQLEAGTGNISIALLHRVALALGAPMEGFLSDAPLPGPQALEIARRFERAPEDLRAEVARLLESAADTGRDGRICLVGLRGAGKTTLGALAGAALGLPFVELNREIEDQSGMPVDEVIALYGQEGYRALEHQALARAVEGHGAMILAVAGGIVSAPETYEMLLARCHTVWLRTSPDEHMARVRAQGDERPMAGNPAAMAQLRSILRSREALYERAEAQLDTTGQSREQSLADLLALIEARGFLDDKK